ncbi:MAG: hypothetical protein ACE5LC_08935 [Candidatus Aminicenantales bacterium]
MKPRKITAYTILLGFALSLSFSQAVFSAQKKGQKKGGKQEEKKEEKIIIPPEIQSILKQGLDTREGYKDINCSITRNLILPGRNNVYSIFLFKIKNADLGFMPALVPPTEEQEEETQEAEAQPAQLQTALNFFLQFYTLKNKKPVSLHKEVWIPVFLQEEEDKYNPDKEELYTISYPLPPGDYLLAMAITSLRTQKIGTVYYEFSLPDLFAPFAKLNISPVIFARSVEEIPSPEMTAEVHRGFFNWSILKIKPVADNILSPKDQLEIFFFISGAQVDQTTGRPNLKITYEVLQEEKPAIRYEPILYASPFIEQPLRLEQTVIIKQDGKEIRRETRPLKPGEYTLSIKVMDKISGNSVAEKIPFEVKTENSVKSE